jgi:hypothetical protein
MNDRELHDYARALLHLFINSCCRFAQRRLLDIHSLDLILSSIYLGSSRVAELLARESAPEVSAHLQSLFSETGLSYFKPCESILLYPDIP